MRKIYVLVFNSQHDPRTLPEGEIKYVFRFIKGALNVPVAWNKLEEVISKATEHDLIVFNGPGPLVAMAGYFWYTNPNVTHHNILTYNVQKKMYELYAEEIPYPKDL